LKVANVKVDLLVYNYNGQIVKQNTQRYTGNQFKFDLSALDKGIIS
jgi:hypothetical protein